MHETVLVTGGAGFIGSHLVEHLLGGGAAVRIVDNFPAGREANLSFAATYGTRLTYIDNVVHANVLAAEAEGAGGEAFNVGCGERISLLSMVEKLETLLGRPLARRHTPGRAGDVPHTLADLGKAKRLLGFSPRVDFDDGFRRTVEFFRHVPA